ncbi:MAG: serine/threonine-protein kinase [Treponema sp.]|nr:serine/threonine-protein kinase [Treponema sp.]
MPAKVTVKVIKGEDAGKTREITEHETVMLGRAEDCTIVLHDPTVSRYHCMVDITPPQAAFHDFGSLNGMYLNNKLVVEGRGTSGLGMEDARNLKQEIFPLKDGDIIGLGQSCELLIKISEPQCCADCIEELDEGNEEKFKNNEGENICEKCHIKLQQKRKHPINATVAENSGAVGTIVENSGAVGTIVDNNLRQKNACLICHSPMENNVQGEARICGKCRKNPLAVLELMLHMAAEGDRNVSPIKGYRNIRELGKGGMGVVWLVEEEVSGEKAALKIMLPDMAVDENARTLFTREVSIGRCMNHKNVIRQINYGVQGDTLFLLQEVCLGGSVDNLMEKIDESRLPAAMAADIILQILEGLDYAHNAAVEAELAGGDVQKFIGIVHRDIKPANFFIANEFNPEKYFERENRSGKLILRSFDENKYRTNQTERPHAKIADFGLAKAFEAAGLSRISGTEAKGTPVFMPRQQVINCRYSKPEVDVWAAAASFYFMLTGQYVKNFGSPRTMWQDAVKNPAVPIRDRSKSVDKRLARVIDEALVDMPDIPIKKAHELKEEIEGAIG